ncbi:signal peptide protein, partial [Intrasporangium oryzae NRRL B-24470]
MGIINRVEHGLAKAVHGAFAKAFKSEVQPVEIASAIRRAMDDRAAILGHGRAMVPNLYTIELSATDYERLGDYEDDLSEDLVAAAQEHADSQGYQPGGPLEVVLVEGEGLETGVFRVRPATAKRAGEPAVGHSAPAGHPGPAGYPPAGGSPAA